MVTYKINKFCSFNDFKEKVGNINQYLITSIKGINKLDKSDSNTNDPAPWNPYDVEAAKDRAIIYTRKAGLVWCIECLDDLLDCFIKCFYDETDVFIFDLDGQYVKNVKKKSENVDDNEKGKSFEKVGRSVYYKFAVAIYLLKKEDKLDEWRRNNDCRVGKKGKPPYFPDLDLVFAIVDLAIFWRNKFVHNDYNEKTQKIPGNISCVLKKYKDILNSNEYGTLDVFKLFEDYDNDTITFKEVAVLIRSIIDFGFILNAYWVEKVDRTTYITKKLNLLLKDTQISKLRSLPDDRHKSYIIQYLRASSISLITIESDELSDEEKAINEFMANIDLLK